MVPSDRRRCRARHYESEEGVVAYREGSGARRAGRGTWLAVTCTVVGWWEKHWLGWAGRAGRAGATERGVGRHKLLLLLSRRAQDLLLMCVLRVKKTAQDGLLGGAGMRDVAGRVDTSHTSS